MIAHGEIKLFNKTIFYLIHDPCNDITGCGSAHLGRMRATEYLGAHSQQDEDSVLGV